MIDGARADDDKYIGAEDERRLDIILNHPKYTNNIGLAVNRLDG